MTSEHAPWIPAWTQAVVATAPPGFVTRSISAVARVGSGANMAPNAESDLVELAVGERQRLRVRLVPLDVDALRRGARPPLLDHRRRDVRGDDVRAAPRGDQRDVARARPRRRARGCRPRRRSRPPATSAAGISRSATRSYSPRLHSLRASSAGSITPTSSPAASPRCASRTGCAPAAARSPCRRASSPRRSTGCTRLIWSVHLVRDRAVGRVALAAGAQLDQLHRLARVEVQHVADPVAEAERVGRGGAEPGVGEARVLGAGRARARARRRRPRRPRRPPPGTPAPRSGVSACHCTVSMRWRWRSRNAP